MIGEYVTCISNTINERFGYKYITKGKKYQIIDVDNLTREYQIIDDIENHNFFPIWMFKTTQELREGKLKELGI
jgi:hypothetical protein